MWNRIKGGLIRFFSGRYGVDALNRFLLISYLIVFLLGSLLSSSILSLIAAFLAVYMLIRMLSRNHYARSKENRVYLSIKGRIVGFFRLCRDRFRDRKTHIYRTCPSCKAPLRLPRTKGEHTVRCPKCANRFDVKVK